MIHKKISTFKIWTVKESVFLYLKAEAKNPLDLLKYTYNSNNKSVENCWSVLFVNKKYFCSIKLTFEIHSLYKERLAIWTVSRSYSDIKWFALQSAAGIGQWPDLVSQLGHL